MKRIGVAALAAIVLAIIAVVAIERADVPAAAGTRWESPSPAAPTTPAPPTESPSPSSSPSGPPAYEVSVKPLPAEVQADMKGKSYKPGCPFQMTGLALITLTYWGFDDQAHTGELVADARIADRIGRIFGKLYAARFPIRKMVRIDAYDGSDDRSMADDNTSMFNCRKGYGSEKWSVHAFGRAVDINTIENPYFPNSHTVVPPQAKAFADRENVRPGMIVSGDVVVKAFNAEGFFWAGDRPTGKDLQHFEVR
jgi:hypothetical protein